MSYSIRVLGSLYFNASVKSSFTNITFISSYFIGFFISSLVQSKFSNIKIVSAIPEVIVFIESSIPKQTKPVSVAIWSKNLLISYFSLTNFTDLSDSSASVIAWLNPFSNPYDVSTILITYFANLPSNIYDYLSLFLKSADPAKINPLTFILSLVIKWVTANSATFLR